MVVKVLLDLGYSTRVVQYSVISIGYIPRC